MKLADYVPGPSHPQPVREGVDSAVKLVLTTPRAVPTLSSYLRVLTRLKLILTMHRVVLTLSEYVTALTRW